MPCWCPSQSLSTLRLFTAFTPERDPPILSVVLARGPAPLIGAGSALFEPPPPNVLPSPLAISGLLSRPGVLYY